MRGSRWRSRTTPLADVVVTLNGADVTSAFGPDSEGNHQLEGVVTGLPLGESTVAASTHKSAKGTALRRAEARQQPDSGPDLLRPAPDAVPLREPGNSAGMGLPPIPQSPTCETPTVVSFVYRSTRATFLPVRPGRAAAGLVDRMTTTMDGKTVPMILRWERGVINRFMYSIMMLSPGSQNGDARPLRLERKALFSFSGGVAIGHYQGAASGGDMRHLAGLRWATPSSTRAAPARTRTTTSSSAARRRSWSGPLRLGLRGAGVHDRRRRLRRRDPAVRLRPEPSGPARRRRAAVLVPGHGHADDPRRRLRAARALDGQEVPRTRSMWRTWVNRA